MDFQFSEVDYQRFNAGHKEYDDLAQTEQHKKHDNRTTTSRLLLWLYIAAGALLGSCGYWGVG
jgi:hypothetical protein